jgi:phosphate transport system substrate-binding protein
MRKRFTGIMFSLLPLLVLYGCGGGGGERNVITIKGSDTMVILGQRWAEHYMEKNPGVIIQVTGGGSGTGIAALINAATDICQASRPMKEKEKKMAEEKHGKPVNEIAVALDGIAIYMHEVNTLADITLAQLKSIYTGKTKDWNLIGGSQEGRIVAYGRENNSGTYLYFLENVLEDEDFDPQVQSLPGTAAVVNAVSKDPASIGYGGIAYLKGIKVVPVKRDDESNAVEPTLANVVDGTYPVSRELFFYIMGDPEGEMKAFIDWVLSEDGQKVCEEVGYYPLPRTEISS